MGALPGAEPLCFRNVSKADLDILTPDFEPRSLFAVGVSFGKHLHRQERCDAGSVFKLTVVCTTVGSP
jgi:hypothetical protein